MLESESYIPSINSRAGWPRELPMKTMQDMHEEAAEEGASLVELWTLPFIGPTYVMVDDTGVWYFRDNADHLISEEDAMRLLNAFSIGYADLWV